MIVTAIVVALTLFFALPIQQAVDSTVRAELTDIAHNSLQRIGRDVRLALPNSVRTDATRLEFIPLRAGGRYRVEAGGACTGVADDHLAFGVADGCFKSLGPILNIDTVTTDDFLVLNNFGVNFTSQDAYAGGNRRPILAGTAGQQVNYNAGAALTRQLHDSPGRRFFIVARPVSYVCDLGSGTLTRVQNYTNGPDNNGFTPGSTPPATFTGGTSAVLATNVVGCEFDYLPNVAPMVGLVTLRLTLRRAVSTGNETVTLYHAVHVNNVP